MAAIVRVRDDNGNVFDIPALVGPKGDKGDPGKDAVGTPGKDGVSPVVSVSDITGGHRVTITDANGAKTFDVMDGEDGVGGGGAGVHIGTEAPTDENVTLWLDTDEEAPSGGGVSSWNDLTDKPFGSEVSIGAVLEETSPTYIEDESAFVLFDPISLVAGGQYTVNWNGTEYNCICGEFDETGNGDMVKTLGNSVAMGGDDTGEPFFIMCVPDGLAGAVPYSVIIASLDGSSTLTLSITGMVETVMPIPDKFLPYRIIDLGVSVSVSDKGEAVYTPDMEYGKVRRYALMPNTLVRCVISHASRAYFLNLREVNEEAIIFAIFYLNEARGVNEEIISLYSDGSCVHELHYRG